MRASSIIRCVALSSSSSDPALCGFHALTLEMPPPHHRPATTKPRSGHLEWQNPLGIEVSVVYQPPKVDVFLPSRFHPPAPVGWPGPSKAGLWAIVVELRIASVEYRRPLINDDSAVVDLLGPRSPRLFSLLCLGGAERQDAASCRGGASFVRLQNLLLRKMLLPAHRALPCPRLPRLIEPMTPWQAPLARLFMTVRPWRGRHEDGQCAFGPW